jgi:signal transduction histidine kinase/phage shock protein PspC (stress-responsive transcriptional regulator)
VTAEEAVGISVQRVANSTPRLARPVRGRLIGGVAQGVGLHLGVNPTYVRVAFMGLSVFGGAGIVMYAVLWAVLPQSVPRDGTVEQPGGRFRNRSQVIALAVIAAVAVFVIAQLNGGRHFAGVLLPAVVGGAGIALVWRQADDAQRARWSQMTARIPWLGSDGARGVAIARLAGGGALLLVGAIWFIARNVQIGAIGDGLMAAAVLVGGLALITGPWWWRLASELTAERRERIRGQERAELAAHVHDSVLQTLALIQRHAAEPTEVARLARGQERELRSWLYRRPATPSAVRFGASIELAAAEVEDSYGVTVETVVVGDTELDPALEAMVQATREALVNAAKHSGVREMSLYAEVTDAEVTSFVRDRGSGFDPGDVPAGHHGLEGSIVGRMQRHGGRADVRSSPGNGTEIELSVPRAQR